MVSKKETSSSKSTATAKAESPLMRQYAEIKQKHPDAILLFRVGDFYETFGQDAVFTSKVLDIVLTRKAGGGGTFVELAGIPYHALDSYLHKLVKAGKKVAICEQLEDPKLTKKLVKRGVTELITPGISLNDKLLERGKKQFSLRNLSACLGRQGERFHFRRFQDAGHGRGLFRHQYR